MMVVSQQVVRKAPPSDAGTVGPFLEVMNENKFK
jgi:hypothetical protein